MPGIGNRLHVVLRNREFKFLHFLEEALLQYDRGLFVCWLGQFFDFGHLVKIALDLPTLRICPNFLAIVVKNLSLDIEWVHGDAKLMLRHI